VFQLCSHRRLSRVKRESLSLLLGFVLLAAAGCAPRLESQTAGNPAAALLQGGFATVLSSGPGSGPRGAAVAMDRSQVLTSAHVLPGDATAAWLQHPDGATARAQVVARVEWAQAVLEGSGSGFVARIPALMGYSGGPMVGRMAPCWG